MQLLKVGTLDDIEEIKAKCYAFYNESPYNCFSYSEERTVETITQVLQMDKKEAIVLLSKNGILAAKVVVIPFSHARVSHEIVWWIAPEARGTREGLELLAAYEYWADNIAIADGCQMSCLATLNPDKLDRLYQRKGYFKTDISYLRIFN